MNYLLLALATYRLSYMLVYEAGPFHIFSRVRLWVKAGEYDCIENGSNSVLCCIWCTSVWAAIALYALSFAPWGVHVIAVLAISGAAIIIHNIVRRLTND